MIYSYSYSWVDEDQNTLKRVCNTSGACAFVPTDPGNIDYQQYLEWLAEGNEPLPADQP